MTFENRFFASPYLYLPAAGGVYKRVAVSDITTIEAKGNYSNFKTKQAGSFCLERSLTSLHEQLNPYQFCQVNRNTIVQLGGITVFTYQMITLDTKEEIDIGPTYLDEFLRRIDMIKSQRAA